MTSGKMDEKAAKRIADARGKKDPFAKRAHLAYRNNMEREREGSGAGAGGGAPRGPGADGSWRNTSTGGHRDSNNWRTK